MLAYVSVYTISVSFKQKNFFKKLVFDNGSVNINDYNYLPV